MTYPACSEMLKLTSQDGFQTQSGIINM